MYIWNKTKANNTRSLGMGQRKTAVIENPYHINIAMHATMPMPYSESKSSSSDSWITGSELVCTITSALTDLISFQVARTKIFKTAQVFILVSSLSSFSSLGICNFKNHILFGIILFSLLKILAAGVKPEREQLCSHTQESHSLPARWIRGTLEELYGPEGQSHTPHSGVRAVGLVLLLIIWAVKKKPEVTDQVEIQCQLAEIECNLSEYMYEFPIIIFV